MSSRHAQARLSALSYRYAEVGPSFLLTDEHRLSHKSDYGGYSACEQVPIKLLSAISLLPRRRSQE